MRTCSLPGLSRDMPGVDSPHGLTRRSCTQVCGATSGGPWDDGAVPVASNRLLPSSFIFSPPFLSTLLTLLPYFLSPTRVCTYLSPLSFPESLSPSSPPSLSAFCVLFSLSNFRWFSISDLGSLVDIESSKHPLKTYSLGSLQT